MTEDERRFIAKGIADAICDGPPQRAGKAGGCRVVEPVVSRPFIPLALERFLWVVLILAFLDLLVFSVLLGMMVLPLIY